MSEIEIQDYTIEDGAGIVIEDDPDWGVKCIAFAVEAGEGNLPDDTIATVAIYLDMGELHELAQSIKAAGLARNLRIQESSLIARVRQYDPAGEVRTLLNQFDAYAYFDASANLCRICFELADANDVYVWWQGDVFFEVEPG